MFSQHDKMFKIKREVEVRDKELTLIYDLIVGVTKRCQHSVYKHSGWSITQ